MNTLTQKQDQLEPEYKKWEMLLNSLKHENAFLILKLSEVLDGKEDKEFISKAEYFQNEFITKDEYIKELKNDIKVQLQLISGSIKDEKILKKILMKHEKLRNEIIYFEKNFSNLKMEFDQSILKDA
jgi:hypothetical protein